MQQLRAEATRRRDAAALQYGVLHETPQEDALVRMYVEHLSHRDQFTSASRHLCRHEHAPLRCKGGLLIRRRSCSWRSIACATWRAAASPRISRWTRRCKISHVCISTRCFSGRPLSVMVRWRSAATCLVQVSGPGCRAWDTCTIRHSSPAAADTPGLAAGLVCLRNGTPIAAGPHQAFAAGGSLSDSGAISAWLQLAGLLTSHSDAHLATPPAAPATEVTCCFARLLASTYNRSVQCLGLLPAVCLGGLACSM